ncbi:MAG: hypothetical protein JWQ81_6150 [Amycolatopsis sp.]|uniref:hypothetical protein n=1 Tax=Amycolatopsis sp. TaxID=37632 RepID=UPI00261556D1|nr:hypothetical protein [Amycolatopsis sp.]MCU1685411.1 hypothetical protein [Amycolatopsis sp.]
MLAEFAVLRIPQADGEVQNRAIIEWPSAVDDDQWISCGEVGFSITDGLVREARISTNSQFELEVSEEYPGDNEAHQVELEALIHVVAYYMQGVPGITLAPTVTISTSKPDLTATFYPDDSHIEFESKDMRS